ncbi:ceramidase domain-containing protein [Microbacterium sp. B2969]|uniref:Ceramidase domain-containing protein n=1 Tax=Microbacterium alkaliflavum TaxID=3248839 RepID=A0ABW7QEC2_9MICO
MGSSYRSIWVLAVAAPAVLIPFLMFVWFGWPGDADICTLTNPNGCFCEAYDPAAVLTAAGGVRQLSNTWFNLYALASASIVAVQLSADRRRQTAVFAPGVIPDVYVFVVLFLGLGSMWFHASLKEWGGIVDAASMYLFTAFLVAFAAYRLRPSTGLFWILFLGVTAVATIAHAVINRPGTSVVLIAIQVGVYMVLELVVWLTRLRGHVPRGWRGGLWWFGALASIGIAIVFWLLSQTGGPLCDPASIWQPHGVAWHPLAGVSAVLLFYYWRESARATEPRIQAEVLR